MNNVYLVRHGENRANLTKEFSHRLVDYGLTEKGVLQSQQTAAYFRDQNIHAIYSSPLKRARETAQIIADELGLSVGIIEVLREVNVGALERQPPSRESWDLHDRIIAAWYAGDKTACFPEGEDYFGLLHRMQSGLMQAVDGATGHNIIIVGHGGIFKFALHDVCRNVKLEDMRGKRSNNCAVTELRVEKLDGALTVDLVRWAYDGHLSGKAAEFVYGIPRPGESMPKPNS